MSLSEHLACVACSVTLKNASSRDDDTQHRSLWPRGRAGAHRKCAARLSECHSHSELLHDRGNREQKEGPPAAPGYWVSASQESERGPGHSVGTEEGLARTTAGFHVCHPNSERGGLDSKPAPFLWAPRICFLKHGCVRHGDLYGLQTAPIRLCCCLVSRATAVSPHALCHILCGCIPARSPSLTTHFF